MQVESDDRCVSVLKTHFPGARLHREVSSLQELPGETEILAAAVNWPEHDGERIEKPAQEHFWLPASRASAMAEHEHIFRLLASRSVPWVVLEIPVALLEWTTSAIPGEKYILLFAFALSNCVAFRKFEFAIANLSHVPCTARPPHLAKLVKDLELLGYRWAYSVVNLLGEFDPHWTITGEFNFKSEAKYTDVWKCLSR